MQQKNCLPYKNKMCNCRNKNLPKEMQMPAQEKKPIPKTPPMLPDVVKKPPTLDVSSNSSSRSINNINNSGNSGSSSSSGNSSSSSSSSSGGSNTLTCGQIAAICIGCVLFLIIVAIVVYFVVRRYKDNKISTTIEKRLSTQ
jgi:preprotein translocase subunit SecG